MSGYSVSPEQCDVSNVESLNAFRECRTRWLNLMNTEPQHAVWFQIYGMLWNYVAFRVANESRRLAHASGEPRAAQNGLIGELLDRGFIATQALAVRRLQERANKEPEKQVVSLGRVLDDIAAHQKFITRENFVAFDGAPYDYTRDRPPIERVGGWRALDKFDHAADAHGLFDRLSGVSPDNRSRMDRMKSNVLGNMFRRLKDQSVVDVADYATKFIAHSSEQQSRRSDSVEGLSFVQLEDCHRALYEVAWKVSVFVLNESDHAALPVPQGDILIHLDRAWSTEEDHAQLLSMWDKYDDLYDDWRTSFTL